MCRSEHAKEVIFWMTQWSDEADCPSCGSLVMGQPVFSATKASAEVTRANNVTQKWCVLLPRDGGDQHGGQCLHWCLGSLCCCNSGWNLPALRSSTLVEICKYQYLQHYFWYFPFSNTWQIFTYFQQPFSNYGKWDTTSINYCNM